MSGKSDIFFRRFSSTPWEGEDFLLTKLDFLLDKLKFNLNTFFITHVEQKIFIYDKLFKHIRDENDFNKNMHCLIIKAPFCESDHYQYRIMWYTDRASNIDNMCEIVG